MVKQTICARTHIHIFYIYIYIYIYIEREREREREGGEEKEREKADFPYFEEIFLYSREFSSQETAIFLKIEIMAPL